MVCEQSTINASGILIGRTRRAQSDTSAEDAEPHQLPEKPHLQQLEGRLMGASLPPRFIV